MQTPPEAGCPICAAAAPQRIVHRCGVAVHQNLLVDDARSARALQRGDLDLRLCGGCGFAFNAAFRPELLQYGAHYENTQTCSPFFESYVDGLAESLIRDAGVRNSRIIEVGCGKGGFLRRLVADPDLGNRGVGFDPSYLGPETAFDGRFEGRRCYFTPEADTAADVVVCRHVIEHVADPLALLRDIAASLSRGAGRKRLFLETPALEWILEHQVVWDLFYEHCSLFTEAGLAGALMRSGFGKVRVRRVFGEQYLWAEAELASPASAPPAPNRRLGKLAADFSAHERALISEWVELVEAVGRRGPVAVWGAGAKGVTFCNLADPDVQRLARVVDINPAKQGKFIPGSGHPIVAPEDWAIHPTGTVLVLNPNYADEIRRRLADVGSNCVAIDLQPRKAAA